MFKFHRLNCRVHVYATENPDKVSEAVRKILQNVSYSVKKTKILGHFGDPITVLEYLVEDGEEAGSVFQRVVRVVGFDSVGVEERPGGGGKLHIRLDKQKALQNQLVTEDVDPVKLEFSYIGNWREVQNWLGNT
ncbi:MAG: RNA-binding domain-containing protein [Candidatus Caldarchaeum sp.]|nr:RNA-binding domain-containing protein [Candidatus Caldarchaeum sp.]